MFVGSMKRNFERQRKTIALNVGRLDYMSYPFDEEYQNVRNVVLKAETNQKCVITSVFGTNIIKN